MSASYTMRGLYFLPMLGWGESQGIDSAALARRFGLDINRLAEPDVRVPSRIQPVFVEELARLSGDPCAGLHMGEMAQVSWWDAMGYACANAPDFGAAVRIKNRFARFTNEATRWDLQIQEGRAHDRYEDLTATEDGARQMTERNFAAATVLARQLVGPAFRLLGVNFRHGSPAEVSEHRRIFDAEVRFLQPVNGLVYDARLLEKPILKAEPQLGRLLEQYLKEALDAMPRHDDFLDMARHRIGEMLREGEPSLEVLADRMAMSPRTLQRRLGEASTGWRELVDHLRQELSLKYLANPSLPAGDVGFLLGFSERAAFHRAFKRWTGLTPGQYRRRLSEEGAAPAAR